jgi:DNA helicase HerA-like ATPase
LLDVIVRNLSKFVNPLTQTGIVAARKQGKTFIYSLARALQEDSNNLRLVIVVEEAHLWTERELPKAALRFLDSAVRLLRKKGVGVMLVSQKTSDFDPAMKSSMNIGIRFRTRYEGDLRAIGRMLGSDMSAFVPKLPVGYSIFPLADVGDPFVMAWRPTLSNP